MAGEFIEFMDMKGTLGKYVYLTANTDPSEQIDVEDIIPTSEDSNGDYMAQVMIYEPNELDDVNKDISNAIMEDSVTPEEISCYYGIIYSGNEFPIDDPGISTPDIVMVLGVDCVFGSPGNGMAMIKELDVYDGRTIADYIKDNVSNDGYSVGLDGDNFFIFIGNIKHKTCAIEE